MPPFSHSATFRSQLHGAWRLYRAFVKYQGPKGHDACIMRRKLHDLIEAA